MNVYINVIVNKIMKWTNVTSNEQKSYEWTTQSKKSQISLFEKVSNSFMKRLIEQNT